MFNFKKDRPQAMRLTPLTDEAQIGELLELSGDVPVLIFKHSTRCGTSMLVRNRLERSWEADLLGHIPVYFLSVIEHRDLSNQVARHFDIMHESPQVLIIYRGGCIYEASHYAIDYPLLKERLIQPEGEVN